MTNARFPHGGRGIPAHFQRRGKRGRRARIPPLAHPLQLSTSNRWDPLGRPWPGNLPAQERRPPAGSWREKTPIVFCLGSKGGCRLGSLPGQSPERSLSSLAFQLLPQGTEPLAPGQEALPECNSCWSPAQARRGGSSEGSCWQGLCSCFYGGRGWKLLRHWGKHARTGFLLSPCPALTQPLPPHPLPVSQPCLNPPQIVFFLMGFSSALPACLRTHTHTPARKCTPAHTSAASPASPSKMLAIPNSFWGGCNPWQGWAELLAAGGGGGGSNLRLP